jgi:hypothetical protein
MAARAECGGAGGGALRAAAAGLESTLAAKVAAARRFKPQIDGPAYRAS